MSKAYFCLYRTQRAAQKDGMYPISCMSGDGECSRWDWDVGWKRVHVEQEWFVEKGWNLTGGYVFSSSLSSAASNLDLPDHSNTPTPPRTGARPSRRTPQTRTSRALSLSR